VIEPALQAAEISRSVARPTNDPTAYDLYLAAYAMLWRSAQVPEALRLLEAAIARDPNYGPALAWAAICCNRLMEDDRDADVSALRRKGISFARHALEVADDDPMTLANAAESLAVFGEDNGAMSSSRGFSAGLRKLPWWPKKARSTGQSGYPIPFQFTVRFKPLFLISLLKNPVIRIGNAREFPSSPVVPVGRRSPLRRKADQKS
jgi:hypothetical protein